MLRYNSHKQALIMTALVILLCLVCLTGATLALFVSDPNDGTIGIVTTSGDVEVDIVDAETGTTLQGQTLDFVSASGDTEVQFEPGATFYTKGFKVKNVGDIPVNFRLFVSDDPGVDMEEFNRAFEVWITTDPNDPSGATEMKPFVGRLEVNEPSNVSGTYYLMIKMRERPRVAK